MTKTISILIADDEIISQYFFQEIFDKNKFEILFAQNGLEALEIFKQNKDKIDLILMDMEMPVMNGYEATKEIRKIGPHIPILAQTAHAYKEELDKALDIGCNDFISKPIKEDELLAKTKKLLKIQ